MFNSKGGTGRDEISNLPNCVVGKFYYLSAFVHLYSFIALPPIAALNNCTLFMFTRIIYLQMQLRIGTLLIRCQAQQEQLRLLLPQQLQHPPPQQPQLLRRLPVA